MRRLTTIALMLGAALTGAALLPGIVDAAGPYCDICTSQKIEPDGSSEAKFILWENAAGSEIFSVNKTTGVVTFGVAPSMPAGAFSGQLGVSSGTAAEPAIVFTADDDGSGTGIYRSAANTLAISTNGVLAASIDANADLAVVRDVSALGLATTTRPVSLGNGSSTFAVSSTGIDISTAGAVSNVTSLAMGGALSGVTTLAASSTISTTNGSITSADLDGYNGGSGSVVSGVPTVRMDVVAGTTGAQDVILDNCEAGAAATWTPSGAAAPSDADDAVTFRVGSGAVAVTYGDVGVGDAIETMATGANWDATDDEYIFVWVRSSSALSAGTITVTLDDDDASPDAAVNLPAVTVANQWQLLRVDISGVANADKDVVANLVLTSNHATELDSAVVHFDQFIKVDAGEATALAFDAINQPGGARSGFSFVEDAGNGTFAALAEYTDFFIDYVNDDVYWMSDQSTLNDILLYASAS